MYRRPSARKRSNKDSKLNLTPILDAVFIFIFFLLMSASFLKVYEISSNVPTVSNDEPPPSKTPPLALTISVYDDSLKIYTGLPSQLKKVVKKTGEGKYDFEELRTYLISLKQAHKQENTAILEPKVNITYEDLINIMDAVRMLRDSDPAIYRPGKDGVEEKVKGLFDNIVFGNITS